jgi:hypothetical protein
MPEGKRWERRRSLRWGSEHVGWHESEYDAREHAYADIKANGGVGRIESTDWAKRILYYDVYEEMA